MIWNEHSKLEGRHALLSPSQSSWADYSEEEAPEKLVQRYQAMYAQELGTVTHEYAEKRIRYLLKVNKHEKNAFMFYLLDHGIPREVIDVDFVFDTFMQYVNDAIGFRMDPEIVLYYSDHCFGTTDAIAFRNNLLRIHDLKSGKNPAHMRQLEIYAALFCLEYHQKPMDIQFELRLYQAGEIIVNNPAPDAIEERCKAIIRSDSILNQMLFEGGK